MRPPRVLLLVAAVAAGFSVLATLVSESRAALQSGLVAGLAFLGWVLLAGASAPRVRAALAAGLGFFVLVMAVRLWWLPEQPAGDGWLEPFYTPLDGRGSSAGSGQFARELLDHWRQGIDRERLAAVGLLLGVLCLAVAVFALPARHRPRRAMVTRVAVAVLLLVVVGADVWARVDDAPLPGLLGAAWPALLAILVAAGTVVLSGVRSDRFALVALGALLLAVTAGAALTDLADSWAAWQQSAEVSEHAFLSVGIAVPVGRWTDLSEAVRAAVAFAGPALLAVGALRASDAPEPPGPR
ncbi:aminopeptidase [Micromonospora sp. WMMD812]|uniref:aminopeptidase n=1 Tax=Micromonospora sp. WMMD812 TaxID=3015152 RepID=UPI00248D0315|nr:aminopeptidase [Micromonospora sp. WMMD812]WBB65951.1 aminopeptidase [Micromonospora sp. WMMD812]